MRPLPRLGTSLAPALALIACTGCVPNVSWLPDSSGFFHSGREGQQLIHYDLATRKQQVIVEDTGTKTAWPAVSPDGTHVAVARHVVNKDMPDYLEVILFDRKGKEVQRSASFRWNEPTNTSNGSLGETYLFWAPRGEHLIVMAGGNTGIYDVRNDGLIVLDNAMPFMAGNTPIRPDGDGFLVSRKVNDTALKYTYVNWEGREYDLALKPVPVREEVSWLNLPFLYHSRWDGNVAVVKHAANQLRLDTGRYQGSLRDDAPRERADAELHQETVFANNAVLRIWSTKPTDKPGERAFRIEFQDSPQGEPRVLAGRLEIGIVFPAPNRKLAAVRCSLEGKGNTILVIDEKGTIVAEVAVGN